MASYDLEAKEVSITMVIQPDGGLKPSIDLEEIKENLRRQDIDLASFILALGNVRGTHLINQDEFRELMKIEYHLIPDEDFNLLYNKAWDEGHSSGYSEVIYVFDDLYDLYKNILYNYDDRKEEQHVPKKA